MFGILLPILGKMPAIFLALPVQPVLSARKVQSDLKDLPVLKAPLDLKALLDHKAQSGLKDLPGLKVLPDLKVLPVYKVLPGPPVLPVLGLLSPAILTHFRNCLLLILPALLVRLM